MLTLSQASVCCDFVVSQFFFLKDVALFGDLVSFLNFFGQDFFLKKRYSNLNAKYDKNQF